MVREGGTDLREREEPFVLRRGCRRCFCGGGFRGGREVDGIEKGVVVEPPLAFEIDDQVVGL